jgi:hypothetical protein
MVGSHTSFFHIFGPTIFTLKIEKKEQGFKTLDFNPVLMPSVNMCSVKA